MIVFFDKYVNLGDVVEFARFVGYVWQVLLGNCGLACLASFVRLSWFGMFGKFCSKGNCGLVCLAKQVKFSSSTRVTSFESLKH